MDLPTFVIINNNSSNMMMKNIQKAQKGFYTGILERKPVRLSLCKIIQKRRSWALKLCIYPKAKKKEKSS